MVADLVAEHAEKVLLNKSRAILVQQYKFSQVEIEDIEISQCLKMAITLMNVNRERVREGH